jgi:hypothetical protein
VVQHVVEDKLDVAEDGNLAMDLCKPVLGICLNVYSTCPWFDAIDQVEPIPGADREGTVLSRSAQ